MITYPQEAAILRGRHHDKTITSLKHATTLNQLKPLANSNGIVLAVVDGDDVMPFTVPVTFYNVKQQKQIAIDLRNNRREYNVDEVGSYFEPKPYTDTAFLVNHALSQLLWEEGVGYFRDVYWEAGRLYATWCGSKIAKRLTLTKLQEIELIAYFGYFWYTRGLMESKLTQGHYEQLVGKMSQLFGYNFNELLTILNAFDLNVYPDLDAFCQAIALNNPNPKLQKFNRVLFQTLMFGSWFGTNSKDWVGLATEYPPTFMNLVYRGLNERTFKDTDITQIALRLMNSVKQKQYTLAFANLLRETAESTR